MIPFFANHPRLKYIPVYTCVTCARTCNADSNWSLSDQSHPKLQQQKQTAHSIEEAQATACGKGRQLPNLQCRLQLPAFQSGWPRNINGPLHRRICVESNRLYVYIYYIHMYLFCQCTESCQARGITHWLIADAGMCLNIWVISTNSS